MATALEDLLALAGQVGARVTSTNGGRHNTGSKHYRGEAIDIDHRNVDANALYKLAQSGGFRVLDERTRPVGQAVWGGPHFHVEVDRAARKGKAAATPQQTLKQTSQRVERDKAQARAKIDAVVNSQPIKRETNFLQDIGRGVQNVFDPQSPLPQNPIAGTIGGALPALGATVAGGVLGGPVGAGLAGGAVFGTMEKSRQQRAGEKTNLGKLALQTAGGAIGGALPVYRGGSALSALAKNFGINAALEGGVETGTQLMDGKISDPGRIASQAAIGGAMGLAPLGIEALSGVKALKPGAKAPTVKPLPVDIQARIKELEAGRFTPEAGANPATPLNTPLQGSQPLNTSTVVQGFRDNPVAVNELKFQPFVHGNPKPRVGGVVPQFESDIDRALYIVANRKSLSNADDKFGAFVRQVFPDLKDSEIDRLAANVKTKVIDSAKKDGIVKPAYKDALGELFPVKPKILDPNQVNEQAALDALSTKPIVEPLNDSGLVIARRGETKPSAQLLDAQGRPIEPTKAPELVDAQGKPLARGTEIDVEGQKAKVIGNPEGKVKVRLEDGTTKVVERPAVETKAGAFTDVINDLLKPSGVDFGVIRQLKADIDAVGSLKAQIKELETLKKEAGGARTAEGKAIFEQIKALKEQYKGENQPLQARWKAVDENIKELVSAEVDSNTGIGIQKPINPETQLPLSAVVNDLDEDAARKALVYAEAMANNTRVKERYIAEQVGRSNEVAKLSKGGRVMVQATEFSPTHFGYINASYPDGVRRVPVVHGYNQRGHERVRYLMRSPEGSLVQGARLMNKPAFKGTTPNILQGQGTFDARELLARGPQTKRGFVKTSEAVKTLHEQKLAIRQVMDDVNVAPELKQKLQAALDGHQGLTYDDVLAMRPELDSPEKLANFCRNLGLQ